MSSVESELAGRDWSTLKHERPTLPHIRAGARHGSMGVENDAVTEKIDTELVTLQDTLKDRLKETNDLADLNQTVFKSSMQLEKHSVKLESSARRTKWMWLMNYAKWMIIAGILVTLLLFILFKLVFK